MVSWNWEHFTPKELKCKCGCGQTVVDREFMDRLEALRKDFGKAMPITSGYRCEKHNRAVGGVPNSPHTLGRAADVAVSGLDAIALCCFAVKHGFTGIGLSQKGDGRFVHLDDLGEPYPRPAVWTY